MIGRLRSRLPRAGSSLSVIAAFGLGQLALIGVTPILTRQYSAVDVSIYQLGFAVAIIVQPLATLRLEVVLPVRTVAAARHLFRVGAGATVATGALLSLIALGVHVLSPHGNLTTILLSSALIVVALAWAALDNAWLLRRGLTTRMGTRNLLAGCFGGALQVAAALLTTNGLALAAAVLAGRALATAVTWVPPSHHAPGTDLDRSSDQPYTVRRAGASIFSLALSSVALQAPVLLVSAIIGTVPGGQLSLAQRIAGTPGTLASIGLAQMVTVQVSAAVRDPAGSMSHVVRRVSSRFVALSLLVAPLIALAGPIGVPLLFGHAWDQAGTLLAILALPFGLQLAVLSMIAVYSLAGEDAAILRMQAVRAAALIACVSAAAEITHSVEITAICATVVITAGYASIIIGARRVAARFDAARSAAPSGLAAAPALHGSPASADVGSLLLGASPLQWDLVGRETGAWPVRTAAPVSSSARQLPDGDSDGHEHASRQDARPPHYRQPYETGTTLAQRRAAIRNRRRMPPMYVVTLFAVLVGSWMFGISNRSLLPSRYFNDDARIQTFLHYPYLLTRSGSYEGTVTLYRVTGLAFHPVLVTVVALALINVLVACCVRSSGTAARDIHALAICVAALMAGAIYFAQYSKELFILPLAVLFIYKDRSRWLTITWYALTALYAVNVRSYWLAVLGIYFLNRLVLRRIKRMPVLAGYLTSVVVACTLILSTGIGNSVGYERADVVASLSVDPTTAIRPPFGGGFVANIINTVYVWLTLLVPLPLLRFGMLYCVTAAFIFYLWTMLFRQVRRGTRVQLPTRSYETICLLLAYVTVLALFEPDYGSYLRHLAPFFAFFVLARCRAPYAGPEPLPATAPNQPRSEPVVPRQAWSSGAADGDEFPASDAEARTLVGSGR